VFRTRLLTAIVAVPLVIVLVALGGWWFFALVAAIFTLAVIEFCAMMRQDGFRVAPAFAIALLWLLLLDAQLPQAGLLGPGMSLILLASLGWQMGHRQGKPVADWSLTVAGALYVGWCGAGLLRLRGLTDGLWWALTAIPAIWMADSGAYSIGRACGRHKLAPSLSPGKTWEGYIGGIVVGALTTTALAAVWGLRAGPAGPRPLDGLLLGLLVATLAPLGDLAISMIKRQVGVKDTGTLFPGHGGALDRIDSILWAAVIGLYYAQWVRGL